MKEKCAFCGHLWQDHSEDEDGFARPCDVNQCECDDFEEEETDEEG